MLDKNQILGPASKYTKRENNINNIEQKFIKVNKNFKTNYQL